MGPLHPPRESIHAAVTLRFLYATHADAQEIGSLLDDLVKLRNQADYKLAAPGPFRDAKDADEALIKAAALIELLDAIEAEPAWRANVVASIRP